MSVCKLCKIKRGDRCSSQPSRRMGAYDSTDFNHRSVKNGSLKDFSGDPHGN
jgi:hypothetical protein